MNLKERGAKIEALSLELEALKAKSEVITVYRVVTVTKDKHVEAQLVARSGVWNGHSGQMAVIKQGGETIGAGFLTKQEAFTAKLLECSENLAYYERGGISAAADLAKVKELQAKESSQ